MGQKLFGVATIAAAVAMLVVGGSIKASLIGKCDFKTRSVSATQLPHWSECDRGFTWQPPELGQL